ncbi:MAG TPA: type VI secretion system baseplate subunit TssG [Bryobacteraceae bacterium]|nr:type VI secretion system baseplate subunit TssG [Bryobacteraceae bacterium]
MATTGRAEDSPLARTPIGELLEKEPYLFEFFQAVRLLQSLMPDRAPVGRFVNPSAEVARFQANPSPIFPASQIQALTLGKNGVPALSVNFMGLIGPQGLLPLYYTEMVVDRLRNRDHAMRDFLDIFHHRIISLFYAAWEKYRFNIAYERGERDRFSHHLLDLLGLGTPGLEDRQEVSDDALLFYSGVLALHPRSATALEQVLGDYFDIPVEVEQFVGAWYPMDADSQCELGGRDTHSDQLGFGAVVGNEIWDQQARVRIKLGPLTFEQYRDFLPEGSAWRHLQALAKYYAGSEYDMEVQLILRRDEVPACQLALGDEGGLQLGWTTWVKSAPFRRDPGDTILML